jgi:hypothetical protein
MGKKRAILIVAAIAIVGGLGAYLLGGSADGDPESVRTTNAGAARYATTTESLVAEITATIYQIDRLQLDPSIFNSPAFRTLQDRTQTIPQEVPGRQNPFAPLYSDTPVPTRTSRPESTGGLLNANGGGASVSATGTAR